MPWSEHFPRGTSPEQARLLDAYVALVRRYADRLDLVADTDLGDLEERHVGDSLRALGVVMAAPPGPAVDVGSGAGLPGIPLAIAAPTRRWTLLEPRRLRAAFLDEVVRELDLENCEVVRATAETAAAGRHGHAYAIAIARALAPPPAAVELCRPLIVPGGAIVIFVGRGAETVPNSTEIEPGLIRIEG